jgi:O-antigen ligase
MALLKILIYTLIIIFPLLEVGKISFPNSVSISVNDALVSIVFICFLALVAFGKIKTKGRLFKPIVVFFTVGLASLLINIPNYKLDQIAVSSLYLLRWIAYSSLYLVVINLHTNDKKYLTKLLFISGCIILFLGILQFVFYQNLGNLFYLGWDIHLYRLFSTFFDPNFAGAFFSIFTVYMLGYLLHEKNRAKRFYIWALALLSVLAVVLTYSRSSLVALGVSIFIFLALIRKGKYILLFLLLLAIIILSSPKIFQTEGTNLFRSYSSIERVKNSKVAFDIFQRSPIIGVGFNTYRYAQYEYGYLKGDKWAITHSGSGADNSYLFILATTGVIGFVAYLMLLSRTYSVIRGKNIKSKKNNRWVIVSLSSMSGILISSLFINSLFYPPLMLWMWILIGITESS